MNVVIRADASVTIGSGHVMRCLTIAKKLRAAGCDVTFWMERLEGNLIEYVKKQGFAHVEQAEHANLYIVDHYGLNAEWERNIYAYTNKLVVIDDIARKHDCDLLIDQNAVANFKQRYEKRVPNRCKTLLGTRYLIMRDEFILAREKLKQRSEEVKRLLVFMGGSDPTNETMKILSALDDFTFEVIDIVVGESNPYKKKIEEICIRKGYIYHCQISYLADLMRQADFSIGAGGSTLWERCYVGLPSASTIVAENQKDATEYAAKLGVTINLGWYTNVTIETYKRLLNTLEINEMSAKALNFTFSEKPNPWLNEILELIT